MKPDAPLSDELLNRIDAYWRADKLTEHTRYIEENGIDMPEILNWKWTTDKK